jgi:Protein of unknown function (DUF3248)
LYGHPNEQCPNERCTGGLVYLPGAFCYGVLSIPNQKPFTRQEATPAYNAAMNDDHIQLPAQLATLEAYGGQLVWRIGKDDLSDEVVVRLGYASATPRFAHLPRLRSATDQELQAALEADQINIEWVD